MFGRRTVEEIVGKVCKYGGICDVTPATKDDVRQVVSASIYQVLSSSDFIEYIDEELKKRNKNTRVGYGNAR
jgi:hypothetical protein